MPGAGSWSRSTSAIEPQVLERADAHDVLLSTHLDRSEQENGSVRLRANEGIVLAAA